MVGNGSKQLSAVCSGSVQRQYRRWCQQARRGRKCAAQNAKVNKAGLTAILSYSLLRL